MMNHRPNVVLGFAGLVLAAAAFVVVPQRKREVRAEPLDVALEAPVPLEDVMTDAGAIAPQAVRYMLLKKLPPPAETQKKAGECEPPEEEISGGCWLAVRNYEPPCDPPEGKRRKMWPHGGKCWVPMGKSPQIPTSGGGNAGAIAE